jgi:hypothetical protein
MRKHQVGDICVTVNTKHPAINDGVLVVIVGIDNSSMGFKNETTPYLIRRVDGQVFGSTTSIRTGKQHWARCYEAFCAGYKLKRIVDQGIGPVVMEMAVTHE